MAYSLSRYMPNVSIIMPTYNSHQWISDSIQSVLEQYYEQWELLIVDDGSTDNTKNIVKDFLNDKRIKYYYQENMVLQQQEILVFQKHQESIWHF